MAIPELVDQYNQPLGNRYYQTGRSRFRRMRGSANTAVRTDGERVLHEAHDLARRNGNVESALNSWEANCVGAGIKPRLSIDNPELETAIHDLWARSQGELDADGMQDFYGMQSLVARSVMESGECFARFRPRRLTDGLQVPLQVQLLESDMLPLGESRTLDNGNRVDMGVERNGRGLRVAYHFYRNHPGDTLSGRVFGEDTVRIPASQVLHIGIPKRPGQLRFASHFSPSIESLKLTHDADNNMAERIRTGALFAGFITRPFQDDDGQPTILGEGSPNSSGQAETTTLEAGSIVNLEDGESIYFPDPPDIGANYMHFIEGNDRRFAASLGLTYEQVSGNLHKVSFSSARVGALEMRRRVEQFVSRCLVFQFCSKVWRQWLDEAVSSGAISLPGYATDPGRYYEVVWRHPGWQYVNPIDESQAALTDIRAGVDSRSNVALRNGRDPGAVDRENASDQKRAEQLDLFYDSNPRHVLETKGLVPGESSREKESA